MIYKVNVWLTTQLLGVLTLTLIVAVNKPVKFAAGTVIVFVEVGTPPLSGVPFKVQLYVADVIAEAAMMASSPEQITLVPSEVPIVITGGVFTVMVTPLEITEQASGSIVLEAVSARS